MSELQNPYSKWIRATWIISAICALVPLLILAMRAAGMEQKHWSYLVLTIICVSLLVFCLILLPVLYYTGRKALKDIRVLVEGSHWAHWQYSPEEWQGFRESEWARTKRKAKWTPLHVLAITLGGGLVLAWKKADVNATQGLLLGGAIGIPLGLLIAALIYLLGKSTYKQRLEGPGDVYIGPRGVYQHGSYSTWDGVGVSLNEVKLEAGEPSVLRFEIKGHRGSTEGVRVLVPRGQEKQATELVERFSGRT